METGISTACFYPELTEYSVELLGKAGIKTIEIFFNTHSEFSGTYIKELQKILNNYDMTVYSVHPYFAGFEHYLFFSSYKRRVQETLDYYEYTFEQSAKLGAKIFTFHGDKVKPMYVGIDAYCEILAELARRAESYGITFCQENVVGHRSGDPAFIRELRCCMKDRINFTLDIKQANRSGVESLDMLRAMVQQIKHIHINDYTTEQDCLLPGCGNFDFTKFFDALKLINYNGKMIIEVYRNNFKALSEVFKSYEFLMAGSH